MSRRYEPLRDPKRTATHLGIYQRAALLETPPNGEFTRPAMLRWRQRTLDWLLNRQIWERAGRDPGGLQLYRVTGFGLQVRRELDLIILAQGDRDRAAKIAQVEYRLAHREHLQ